MESHITEMTVKWLKCQVDYLDKIPEESGRFDSDPEAIQDAVLQLMSAAGSLEGRRLKGWSLVSTDIQTIINFYSGCFYMTLDFTETLKPPYGGKKFTVISEKGKTEVLGKCWERFISCLLSVYGMKQVLLKPSGTDKKRDLYTIQELSDSGEELPVTNKIKIREFVHKMNNHLGGIVSFASLIDKNPQDKENAEMILKAAEKASALLKRGFPGRPNT